MKEILTDAAQRDLAAEVYWTTREPMSVRFEGGQPSAVMQDRVDQCAIRVIQQGKLGMACGSRPEAAVLSAAEEAAAGGAEAPLQFAPQSPAAQDPGPTAATIEPEHLLEMAEELHRRVLGERPDIAPVVQATRHHETVRIATTEGFDDEQTRSYVTLSVNAPFHGAGSRVWKTRVLETTAAVDSQELSEEFLEWYAWGDRISTPAAGRLPVLLAPGASFLLSMPLMAAISGESLHQRTSPLEGRLNQQVLGEELTIMDTPQAPHDPLGRRFDDEGTPCRDRPLVERGVLQGYLLDRRTAALLSQESTGNGFKRALFGGGPWAPPNPWPGRLSVSGGNVGWRNLLTSVEQGLLLYGGMGFHSANYLQGNFSVQALGYHVENGTVRGRLHGVMVAGNIYEDFHGVGVSQETVRHTEYESPYILVPELQVAHGG
ncbi:MAG: metallopeptidase TldD-related protein [Candidatus Bipolaricaulota bacterium]